MKTNEIRTSLATVVNGIHVCFARSYIFYFEFDGLNGVQIGDRTMNCVELFIRELCIVLGLLVEIHHFPSVRNMYVEVHND